MRSILTLSCFLFTLSTYSQIENVHRDTLPNKKYSNPILINSNYFFISLTNSTDLSQKNDKSIDKVVFKDKPSKASIVIGTILKAVLEGADFND